MGSRAGMHRDGNNHGPCVTVATGSYMERGLRYWPGDRDSCRVDRNRRSPSTVFALTNKGAVFTGTKAPEVLEFARHDDDFHSIGTAYLDQGTRKHISTVRACNKLQSGGTYQIAECSMELIFAQLWRVSERLCMLCAVNL